MIDQQTTLYNFHGVFNKRNETFVFRASQTQLFVRLNNDQEIELTRDSQRVFYSKEHNLKVEFKENNNHPALHVFILINGKTLKLKRQIIKSEKLSYKIKVNIYAFLIATAIIPLFFLSIAIFGYFFKDSDLSSSEIDNYSKECVAGYLKSCRKTMHYYESISFYDEEENILLKSCFKNKENEKIHMLLANFYASNLDYKQKLQPFLKSSCAKNLSTLCYKYSHYFSDANSVFKLKALRKSCKLGYKKACVELKRAGN